MEIKEITSTDDVTEQESGEKVLRKCDRILETVKENLSPREVSRVEEVLSGLQRDLNCLHDGKRFTKKKALERIKQEVSSKSDQAILTGVFAGLCKPLLTLFHDSIENCRESSVVIVLEVTARLAHLSPFLPYIIPTCVMRLGQPDLPEASEEIRQLLLELLVQLVTLSPDDMQLYCQDIMVILVHTIQDPFAEVKKLSCTCVIALSSVAPRQFHAGANFLLSPLLNSISHQHQKVRALVVQAIGALLDHGDNKMLEDIVSHLAQRTFDPCPPVREAVYRVVGGWMVTLMDRYSYFHRLLPLLLTGVQDEVPQIAQTSSKLFTAAGKQWQEENEQDIKDEKDFCAVPPVYYGVLVDTVRPIIGCRILVSRNLSKIIPGLLNDLNTWVEDTRVKSIRLLQSLLVCVEQNVTQHLEKVLFAFYKCSLDDSLSPDIDRTVETLAQFVKPEIWKPYVISALSGAASGEIKSRVGVSPQYCTSCIRVLNSLVRGSVTSALLPVTPDLLETLCEPEVNQTAHLPLYQELARLLQSFLDVLGKEVGPHSNRMLYLLLRLTTIQRDSDLDDVNLMISKLAELQDLTVEGLYEAHTPSLVEELSKTHDDWTRHSPDRSLFGELLLRSGETIGKVVPQIYTILKNTTNKEKDPELRMAVLTLLGRVLRELADSVEAKEQFREYSVKIISDVILPNLEWRAGRTASTVRCAAVSSLWALLRSDLLLPSHFTEVQKELTAQLIGNLDDDDCATRLVTCNCFNFVLKVGGKECFALEELHKTYPELLKRLDDSSDELRVAVTRTLITLIDIIPAEYDKEFYKAHLQYLYRGLLVHLDDPNKTIQEAVLGVLKRAARLHPTYLIEHIENVKHKHRASLYCDKLLDFCKEL